MSTRDADKIPTEMKLVTEQISLSTAEEEEYYFSEEVDTGYPVQPTALPAGTYRVVRGTLYQVVPGAPSNIVERSGSDKAL